MSPDPRPDDRVDRTAFAVVDSFEAAAAADRAFWHAQTPAQRLAALDLLRRRTYGDAVDRRFFGVPDSPHGERR